MLRNTIIIAALSAVLLLSSFSANVSASFKGVDVEAIDKSVNPADDFYEFSNGSWLRNNPIPETESHWSSFSVLSEQNNKILFALLSKVSDNPNWQPGTIQQKVSDYFSSAMDTASVKEMGMKAIKPYLTRIEAIASANDVITQIAQLHVIGADPLFSFYIMQDAKNSIQYIPYLSQDGLGLPDKDYYLKDDERSVSIQKAYQQHLIKTFELSGNYPESAQIFGKQVYDIELNLAKSSMSRVELRDIEKQYNKIKVDSLKKLAPNIPWENYFKAIGAQTPIKEVVVMQPEFIKKANSLFKTLTLQQWKSYLKWHLLKHTATKLHPKMEQEHFKFYGTTLTGVKEMKPRWKRVINILNETIGEAVGYLYVENNFTPEAKDKVNQMVDNIFEAFKERLQKLEWMSEETKEKAFEKLKTINRKLAYPDKWKDYSALVITRDNYAENFLKSKAFEHKRMIAKIGKPIDRNEWGMAPQTVNAYYNPLMNEIVFPAAIMMPPFFDFEADDAVNYGAIGAVIGHELIHGFDDMGSKFDANGNMENWWTPDDAKMFAIKTKLLVEQFNKFEADKGLFVNGELTLGENIADLGGLSIAYDAYLKSQQGKTTKVIDGFSPEQRFFIAWAQVWKDNMRSEFLRQLVLTNPHAPGKYRVLGPLSNMETFYKAFNVTEKNKMYRDEANRAVIW
jgi:putative endopeptidase